MCNYVAAYSAFSSLAENYVNLLLDHWLKLVMAYSMFLQAIAKANICTGCSFCHPVLCW